MLLQFTTYTFWFTKLEAENKWKKKKKPSICLIVFHLDFLNMYVRMYACTYVF